MNVTPQVSVILPNYNYAHYLDLRIQSILNQTFTDLELIIVDDGSSDNSLEIISKYSADPRVRVIPEPVNSGSPYITWNKGVALARGEYVWIAEADDLSSPYFLSALLKVLEQDSSIVLAYCQSWIINENGQAVALNLARTSDLSSIRWLNDYIEDGCTEISNYFFIRNYISNASAVVFKRDAYLREGGADETMRLCADALQWVRIMQQGRIAYCALPLNYFRIANPDSVRGKSPWSGQVQEEYFRVYQYIKQRFSLSSAKHLQVLIEVSKEIVWRFMQEFPLVDIPGLAKVVTALIDYDWRVLILFPFLPLFFVKRSFARLWGGRLGKFAATDLKS